MCALASGLIAGGWPAALHCVPHLASTMPAAKAADAPKTTAPLTIVSACKSVIPKRHDPPATQMSEMPSFTARDAHARRIDVEADSRPLLLTPVLHAHREIVVQAILSTAVIP